MPQRRLGGKESHGAWRESSLVRIATSACTSRGSSGGHDARDHVRHRREHRPRGRRGEQARHLRRAGLRLVQPDLRQRGAQQHHGEPEAARSGDAVLEHGADGPGHRGQAPAGRLPAARGLALHARHGHRPQEAHRGLRLAVAGLERLRHGDRDDRLHADPRTVRVALRRHDRRRGHDRPHRRRAAQGRVVEPLGHGRDAPPRRSGTRRSTHSAHSAAPSTTSTATTSSSSPTPTQVEHVYCFAYYVYPPKGTARSSSTSTIDGIPPTSRRRR